MGTLDVVVLGPGPDHDPRVGKVAEHGLVKQLIAHPPVEALEEPILDWLSRRDVVPFGPVLGTPAQDTVR